jgi:hypothetical protein
MERVIRETEEAPDEEDEEEDVRAEDTIAQACSRNRGTLVDKAKAVVQKSGFVVRKSGTYAGKAGGRARPGRSPAPLQIAEALEAQGGNAMAGVTPSGKKQARMPEGKERERDELDDAAEHVLLPDEGHFGAMLQRAREDRGLSVQDIAQRTRISARWVEALEAARLDVLPAQVFVSGYVRSYARAVGLPTEEVLGRYQALAAEHDQRAAASERGVRGYLGKSGPRGMRSYGAKPQPSPWRQPLVWVSLAVALCIVLLFAAWLFRRPHL